ncbi:hypothetical protein [Massilia sp. Leaf139]|uniref:hypothetical protein n=1 Tax=Massilia sp. Leaf139 TaxID=1736272 RepID=UPI0006FE8FC7|nr:hypothetical protein [Massilia sp. Leaf139]KQQ97417.1 hypothetical protein ASF77_05595 [Massilia sp. Leaf139]
MTTLSQRQILIIGAGVVGVLALSFYRPRDDSEEEGNNGGFLQDIGEDAGAAVVDLVDGVVSGASKGIGDIVGVPRTNKTRCELAIAEGRTWDASFDCSAGTFLQYINPFK